EDHASLGLGAIALYNLTFDRAWLDRAKTLGNAILERFWDDATQAFFDTAVDGEQLVTRPRDVTDNAMPSGTSLAIELMLILGDLFADSRYTTPATHMLETVVEPMVRYPTAFGHALGAADMAVRGAMEVAITGATTDLRFRGLAHVVAGRYVPSLVMAFGAGASAEGVELLKGRASDAPTAYVCRAYACDAPTSVPSELSAQLTHVSS
ncbi:MAG: thioredoxin domain-containing protein, partial [bacterium]